MCCKTTHYRLTTSLSASWSEHLRGLHSRLHCKLFLKIQIRQKKNPQHSTGSYRSKSFYKLLFWGFPQCMLKLCGMSAILSQSVFFHLLPSAYMYCMHIGPLFRQEACNMSSVFTKLALLLMAIVFLCFTFK